MMQANIQIDEMDARILSAMSADSRRSYADVGNEVGLSTAAVHERVRKLVERGVIRRFSLSVEPQALGLAFTGRTPSVSAAMARIYAAYGGDLMLQQG